MKPARKEKQCISAEKLLELFRYSEGKLFWKIDSKFRSNKESEAGYRSSCGYCYITIDCVKYKRSRLIWALHYGWPPQNFLVDHINRNKLDDKIENLRLVDVAQNRWNSNNIKGYTYEQSRRKYKVTIMVRGKRLLIGRYDTEEEAKAAYNSAKLKYHQIVQAQEHSTDREQAQEDPSGQLT